MSAREIAKEIAKDICPKCGHVQANVNNPGSPFRKPCRQCGWGFRG